jgi:hypothetical protein
MFFNYIAKFLTTSSNNANTSSTMSSNNANTSSTMSSNNANTSSTMSSNNANTSSTMSSSNANTSSTNTSSPRNVRSSLRSRSTSPPRDPPERVEWTDPQTLALIEQRRSRNYEYHYIIPGRSRKNFWKSVAENVNNTCGSNYTGKQCQTKFNGLVTSYHVS